MEYKYFKEHEIRGLDENLVLMLDKAREIAGIPFVITSGLRDKRKNDEVGGVENSAHLSGLAVDIRCACSDDRFDMIKALLEAGFKRLGIYEGHIHADNDLTKPAPVIFLR